MHDRGQQAITSTLVVAESWADLARCRGSDSKAFFARSLPDAREAIRVCERCVVRQECLDYAIEHDMDLGVWGGLTERQRRSYARRMAG